MKIYFLLMMITVLPFAYSNEKSLPPFEKIYVTPYEIYTTPFGSYYRNPSGESEMVSCISNDSEGTYVIIINRQCPNCGRCYHGDTPEKGYCCPLNEKYDVPFTWGPSYK